MVSKQTSKGGGDFLLTASRSKKGKLRCVRIRQSKRQMLSPPIVAAACNVPNFAKQTSDTNMFTLLDVCVSSLRKGNAQVSCIVRMLSVCVLRTRHCVRAVKEMDSKSIGLCPQGFESPQCRFAIAAAANMGIRFCSTAGVSLRASSFLFASTRD